MVWPVAVNKKCSKCGITKKVMPRERRCKQTVFNGSVYCWGKLSRVKRAKPTLEQELEAAHVQLTDAITRVKRAVTSVDHWQARIKSLGKRIDERDHPKPKKPKQRKRTRIITLPEDYGETTNV